MANCLLKYPFNFRLHSIHTRTWWRIKRLEDGMGKHRMTRCYGGYKYGMRATYFHNEYSAYNCLNFPGKRSTKTKIKNINKCVIFESILKTFRTRSFKTQGDTYTCDTTSSFTLLLLLMLLFLFREEIILLLYFQKVSRSSTGCTLMVAFL